MTLLIYSLLAGAILSALWLTYRFIGMMGLTHFRLNRFILVTIALSSILLPLIAFRPLDITPRVQTPASIEEMEPAMVGPATFDAVTINHKTDWSWLANDYLTKAYIIGVAICALWLVVGLCGVFCSLIKGEKRGRLIIHHRNVAPFTWGRWIVLSESDAKNSAILLHEGAHLRACHWAELLLARVVSCFLWYWPTSWLLTRDLQIIHEFEADYKVIKAGVSPTEYQLMLVKAGAARLNLDFVNPFNYYSLKKRIIMMKKQTSSAGSRWRSLALLPSLAAVILLVSAPALAVKVQSNQVKVTELQIVDDVQVQSQDSKSGEDKIFTAVEVTPQFPGGETALYAWLSNNIRYPENAAKNNIQGRVLVQFVVEKDGSIGETKVVRGVAPELDAEAVRVVKLMPKFSPGTMNGEPVRVWYTIPLTFKLAPQQEQVSESEIKDLDVSKVVEAQFPGGDDALYAFVNKNIRYPEADA